MKISRQIYFAKQLIKAHFFQYSFAIFGIFIGTASVFFFLSLTEGVKKGIQKNFTTTENILTVQPSPQKIKIFNKNLNEQSKYAISTITGVKTIYSEIALFVPTSIKLPVPILGDMMLDSYFIQGIDDRFFTDYKKFAPAPENSIPVLLSPIALDFLNSFANSIPGFPGIKKNDLEKRKFSVEFGKSVFLPVMNKNKSQTSHLFVSGFSPMAPLLGIMIPQSKAKELAKFFDEKLSEYSRLHVVINDDSQTEKIKKQIQDMGFVVSSAKEGSEKISQALFLLQGIFLLSSGLILLLSIFFLFSLLTLSVIEHHKTIGVLRSLGASKSVVRNIFIFQGSIISLIGSVSGMIFGGISIYIADTIIKKNIPNISLLPKSLFETSPILIIGLFLGIFIITFLSILIPAHSASQKNPLKLLLE